MELDAGLFLQIADNAEKIPRLRVTTRSGHAHQAFWLRAGRPRQVLRSQPSELFIGSGHHDVMGEIYDVRSAVEHLHENEYSGTFDRALRLELLRKEAIIEFIARTALARIVRNSALWLHFANTPALRSFWALPDAGRKQIWGTQFDPMVSIADFDPNSLHDGHLGAP